MSPWQPKTLSLWPTNLLCNKVKGYKMFTLLALKKKHGLFMENPQTFDAVIDNIRGLSYNKASFILQTQPSASQQAFGYLPDANITLRCFRWRAYANIILRGAALHDR